MLPHSHSLLKSPANPLHAVTGLNMDFIKQLLDTGRTQTRHGKTLKFREGLYQISNQCYAWMVPNGSWGETNIGLIDCNGKSVLIDTCWDLHFTQQMLQGMQPVIEKSPIDTVINTHSDGDHCWGNQLFKDRNIIATHACHEMMHHTKPATLSALQTGCKALRHLPLANINHLADYMGNMLGPYHFKGVTITDPSITFQHEHCLNINGRDIILYEVGPAHTSGDAIVYVPDESVAFAGDIAFVGSTPVMWSGPIENLIAALQRLLDLNAKVMVPGHGPLASRADIQSIIDYWFFVQDKIFTRYQRDMLPEEAATDLLLSREFLDSPYSQWSCIERLVTNAGIGTVPARMRCFTSPEVMPGKCE